MAPAKLRDTSLIGGLLVAAAGAAGLATVGAPVIREMTSGGIAAALILDGCHVVLHTFPDRQLMLLDVLARSGVNSARALEVFTRRLEPARVNSGMSVRGE